MKNKREKIQAEATKAITDNKFNGILEVAPRVGKSKITIDALNTRTKELNVLIVAPRLPILEGWKEEIVTWKLQDSVNVDFVWSNSLKKNNKKYHLIVADEIHDYNEKVLHELKIRQVTQASRILGLTGTLNGNSEDFIKFWLGITPFYTYTVEQAIADKIIADYQIYCIGCDLNDTDKYVKAGTEEAPFYQTEAEAYEYWNSRYEKASKLMQYSKLRFLVSKRREIIYNSKTKIQLAKKLIDSVDRCITFTGLQKIANMLGEAPYHSKSDKTNLDKFKKGLFNKLSVVSMISMGITIPNLKVAIFNQLKSKENLAIQQALRTMNIEGDKKAIIYIIYLKNTRDEEWLKTAINGFEKDKITYCTINDIL